MPAIQTVTTRDSTPTVTTMPYRHHLDLNRVLFVNAGATPQADKTLTTSWRESGTVFRVVADSALPIVVDDGGGDYRILRTLRAKTEWILPLTSTNTERRDLFALHQGVTSAAGANANEHPHWTMVTGLEGLF